MAISTLQKDAFIKSESFNSQVNGIVIKEALYKSETWEHINDGIRSMLSQVVRQPQIYGFASTIISDAAWALTYDVWAADPASKDAEIGGYVQKVWLLLTGIAEPTAPDPVP